MKPTLSSLFPNASQSVRDANPRLCNAVQGNVERLRGKSYETHDQRQIPDSKPQHHQASALDSADAGKAKSVQRVTVRFIGYRCRPLDPDNFAGSCKDLLDGLRHAGIIPGDEPWRIIFETSQEKVKTYAQERTLIEIEIPPVS